MKTLTKLCFVLLLAGALAACNVSLPERIASPTPEVSTIEPPTEAPSDTPPPATLTPSRTIPPIPVLESPTPTPTAGPPTETWTPTPTLGPYEHTMQSGETLGYIIQLYGYTDLSVIDDIVEMNANILNADRLPGAGAVILIPRQTATATPEDFTPSPTSEGALADLPGETTIMQHEVRDGETIVGIAGQFDTTLPVLDQLNPELLFLECDFDNPSGGPDCNVPLSVGQLVNVPAPTPTPTLSPTPSGSETPTATPTYAAPILSFPPEGAIAHGDRILLQWVSTGILPDGLYYLVEIEDTTNGAKDFSVTRDNSYVIDRDLAPTDGQTHAMRWRVRIGTQTKSGTFSALGADAPWRTFQWQ